MAAGYNPCLRLDGHNLELYKKKYKLECINDAIFAKVLSFDKCYYPTMFDDLKYMFLNVRTLSQMSTQSTLIEYVGIVCTSRPHGAHIKNSVFGVTHYLHVRI